MCASRLGKASDWGLGYAYLVVSWSNLNKSNRHYYWFSMCTQAISNEWPIDNIVNWCSKQEAASHFVIYIDLIKNIIK